MRGPASTSVSFNRCRPESVEISSSSAVSVSLRPAHSVRWWRLFQQLIGEIKVGSATSSCTTDSGVIYSCRQQSAAHRALVP